MPPPLPKGCEILSPPHPRAGDMICCPKGYTMFGDQSLCQSTKAGEDKFCSFWGNPGIEPCPEEVRDELEKGSKRKLRRGKTTNTA